MNAPCSPREHDDGAEQRGAETLGQVEEEREGGDGLAALAVGRGVDDEREERRVEQRDAGGVARGRHVEARLAVAPQPHQDQAGALERQGEQRTPPGAEHVGQPAAEDPDGEHDDAVLDEHAAGVARGRSRRRRAARTTRTRRSPAAPSMQDDARARTPAGCSQPRAACRAAAAGTPTLSGMNRPMAVPDERGSRRPRSTRRRHRGRRRPLADDRADGRARRRRRSRRGWRPGPGGRAAPGPGPWSPRRRTWPPRRRRSPAAGARGRRCRRAGRSRATETPNERRATDEEHPPAPRVADAADPRAQHCAPTRRRRRRRCRPRPRRRRARPRRSAAGPAPASRGR